MRSSRRSHRGRGRFIEGGTVLYSRTGTILKDKTTKKGAAAGTKTGSHRSRAQRGR